MQTWGGVSREEGEGGCYRSMAEGSRETEQSRHRRILYTGSGDRIVYNGKVKYEH